MTSDIIWEDPPEVTPGRLQRVAELLRANPGRWARIDTIEGGIQMVAPWWSPLNADDSGFEVRMIKAPNSGRLFPPRRIYARFRASSPSTEHLPPDALLG